MPAPYSAHSEHRFPHLPPNSARIGYIKVNMVLNVHRNRKAYSGRGEVGRGYGGGGRGIGYATEGALFIPAQLSTDAVSALRNVWALIRLWKQHSAQART